MLVDAARGVVVMLVVAADESPPATEVVMIRTLPKSTLITQLFVDCSSASSKLSHGDAVLLLVLPAVQYKCHQKARMYGTGWL